MERLFILLASIVAAVAELRTDVSESGCSFRLNDLGQPQPVYLHNGNYLKPAGSTGVINLNTGEQVTIACPGLKILHPNINTSVDIATATCENNDLISGAGWLDGNGAFSALTCSAIPNSEAVVYDASRRIGTAFVGINNPYCNETEVQAQVFCEDRCRNNSAFNWLKWEPDRIDLWYSFCCTVDDFRKIVPHLPDFPVDDLLT